MRELWEGGDEGGGTKDGNSDREATRSNEGLGGADAATGATGADTETG